MTHCDFCGISKEKADALHDCFEMAQFPFLACTDCMDREFGPYPVDPFIQVENSKQLVEAGLDPYSDHTEFEAIASDSSREEEE